MKNKKVTYILIPAVALVWGLIIYKVFYYVKAEPDFSSNVQIMPVKAKKIEFADTFSLINDYPDPFLDTRYGGYLSENSSGQKKVRQKIEKVEQNWPEISLGGIIVNNKTNKQNICISINRKNLLLTVGEEKEAIRLVKIYNDSVLVEFCGEEKIITK